MYKKAKTPTEKEEAEPLPLHMEHCGIDKKTIFSKNKEEKSNEEVGTAS